MFHTLKPQQARTLLYILNFINAVTLEIIAARNVRWTFRKQQIPLKRGYIKWLNMREGILWQTFFLVTVLVKLRRGGDLGPTNYSFFQRKHLKATVCLRESSFPETFHFVSTSVSLRPSFQCVIYLLTVQCADVSTGSTVHLKPPCIWRLQAKHSRCRGNIWHTFVGCWEPQRRHSL